MTTASQTATNARTSHTGTRAAWLFPGRIELALTVNWQQAAMDSTLHDLKIARERENTRDLTLIARLRQLSAECSMALALCRTNHDA